MIPKTVLLAAMVIGASIMPAAQAYDVELKPMKIHEGGLPHQARFDSEVGRNLSVLTREEFIGALETAWNRWESQMGSGLTTTFVDVGNNALPWAEDGVNTVQYVQEGTAFLGRHRSFGGSSEPWRIEEADIKFNKCSGDCWGNCPFLCTGGERELDLVSISTHEFGHAHGLLHCNSCGTSETCMVPFLPPGECVTLDLGTVDQDICSDMYRHGSHSWPEPANDLWDGAEDLKTLNGSMIGEETFGEGDLGGVLDNDIFTVYISHPPPPHMLLEIFLMAPVDVDVAFEVYRGSVYVDLVNNQGTGGNEWGEYQCEGGRWKVRVFCPDYTSNTWGTDEFILYIVATAAVQDVPSFGPPNCSMLVLDSLCPAPQVQLHAVQHPSRLEIFDVGGRAVRSVGVPAEERWEHRLQGLRSGIYFARVICSAPSASASQRRASQRFIVVH